MKYSNNESSQSKANTIDDVIFDIEDYIGGNVEGVERVDRMGLTVFLRRIISDYESQQVTKGKLEQVKWLIDEVWADDVQPDQVYPRLKAKYAELQQQLKGGLE
jgi:hypothetical protein